ncbi:hypothetical protein [Chengkuizengella marina]|uniref:hypothetical protein n=1 Tax=Chengkuizengella marina TaxID=2507566 RepID=UPI00136E5C64|nr:hypothetical protein [Chengkuizengella marina]
MELKKWLNLLKKGRKMRLYNESKTMKNRCTEQLDPFVKVKCCADVLQETILKVSIQ